MVFPFSSPLSPAAEAGDLKSLKGEFESHRGHSQELHGI